MVVLLKTAPVQVSFIRIMHVTVQNKGKSVWKSRYDGYVSSSKVWGIAGLLLSSRVVLPLSILPLVVLYLLLLSFSHEGPIYQLLVGGERCHHQLHSQLII